jgi:hypothetical protein
MTNELFPNCPADEYELFFEIPGRGEVCVFVFFDDEEEDEETAQVTAAFDENGPIELTDEEQFSIEEDSIDIIVDKIRAKNLHDSWDSSCDDR